MNVRVDGKKCSGIGICEMTAPSVFEIGDADVDRAAAEDAVSSCPTGAISIEA